MITILLAGPSGSGKSILAKALCQDGTRFHVSTSALLRSRSSLPRPTDDSLRDLGEGLDRDQPDWVFRTVNRDLSNQVCVVDAIRSSPQYLAFMGKVEVVTINVKCAPNDLPLREQGRGRAVSSRDHYQFPNAHFTWDSSRVSLSTAVAVINQLTRHRQVDVIIGGQYGSEGKGKLAALIADQYSALVRSGGPNAGHWVRDERYEFCFHQVPSGALANPAADIYIAAGATLNVDKFSKELAAVGCAHRTFIDPNTVVITKEDIAAESELVDIVGSTAQGVGSAASRRILRGLGGHQVKTAAEDEVLSEFVRQGPVSTLLLRSRAVLLEGTQGSELSLYHGPYPFTTSRDTNTSGLLSEVGVPPSSVRDVWAVVRSFPIRVGGNSGPMTGELQWEDIARRTGTDLESLKRSELTSTTKRQRRVANFDEVQFLRMVRLNRPTKLFLSFADYIDPGSRGKSAFADLPTSVRDFVTRLEDLAGCPVVGVSTGPKQSETVWRGR